MKNAAVYLRVSTDKQDEMNQEPSCRRICEARGWTPVLYREVETGTGKRKRAQWDRVLEAARTGQVAAVVVYSIHRIGRKRVQIARDLATLSRYGVAICSVNEKFLDVDSSPEMAPMRDMLIQWWGWFAEREHAEIVTRTNLAMHKIMANIRAHGAHISSRTGLPITALGRPPAPLRWRQRAVELRAAGQTQKEIAAQIAAEGGPVVHRTTIVIWLRAAREAAAPKAPKKADEGRDAA